MRPRPLLFAVLGIVLGTGVPIAGGPASGGAGFPVGPVREKVRIGTSVRGRPIVAFHRGNPDADRSVLVVGCVHGDECAGLSVTRRLMRSAVSMFDLWVIRTTNPDGRVAGTRQNARGVDLNRNFPKAWRPIGSPGHIYYSGPRPLSEPESRAMKRFLERHEPNLTLLYHQRMDLILGPYQGPIVAAACYARMVGQGFRRESRTPGAIETWQNRHDPDHSAFLVELPDGSMSAAGARRHANAVRKLGRGTGAGGCPAMEA